MRSGQLPGRSILQLRDVRVSEQLAYQILQFLTRYQTDIEQLLKLLSDTGGLRGYLEAMTENDQEDARRLAKVLRETLERSE